MRGLTLTEVVVLVVVLSFLVVIIALFPRRTRSVAFRMTCGTNLAGIGKGMMIYANDYDDVFPCAGGPGGAWAARTPNWMGRDRFEAYGAAPDSLAAGQASISASLYLLVKYVEVTPKSFVCTKDKGAREFELARTRGLPAGFRLIDAWDFGPNPPRHVSYAYHMVYGSGRLTMDSHPGMALAADRNPWIASPFGKARDFAKFQPDIPPFTGTTETAQQGNAFAHQGDGQNVLFVDAHVEFSKRAFCSLGDDNIYTSWKGDDKARGNVPRFGSVPADPNDSLLVNDPAVAPSPRRR
jgi:prepilin-type processing-associated H-X9-DG protein